MGPIILGELEAALQKILVKDKNQYPTRLVSSV